MRRRRADYLMRRCASRVHYGWVVLVVATLGKIFTSPGQSPCIGVAIDSVRRSLNMSHTEMTGMYLAATTTSSLMLPATGILIDRLGPRPMVVAVALGLSAACFLMSIAVPGAHLFFTLLMLRFFGQGSLMNVSVTEINYWWVKSRGKAMGLAGAAVSAMMQGVIPVIMMALMDTVGWRGTYIWLGLATLFVMAPLGGLFFRSKPEVYGMLPDGKVGLSGGDGSGNGSGDNIEMTRAIPDKDEKDDQFEEKKGLGDPQTPPDESDISTADSTISSTPLETNWSANEVFRSPAFWAFALPDFVIAGTGTAFWFHLRAAFGDMGVSNLVMQTIYPVMAIISVIGRLFSGWLIDKTSCQLVMIVGLILHSAGLAMVPLMGHNDGLAFIVSLLIGVSGSFTSNVRSTVFASLFGRTSLGKIQTVASSLTVLGSALGPFPFGVSRDVTGSWQAPFAMASAFPLLGALAVFCFGNRLRVCACCNGNGASVDDGSFRGSSRGNKRRHYAKI